jgi:hypothetical protein
MGSTQVQSTPTSSTTNRLTTAGTQYDAEGNLVLWNSGPSYEYDAFNRMRRFRGGVAPGSEEWVFAYTADDERGSAMPTDFQRRLADAVTDAIRAMGGDITFRATGVDDEIWLGESICSRGEILVYLYESDYVADFVVGDADRVLEKPDFDSQEALISAFCEALQTEIAQGPYPFFFDNEPIGGA